MKTMKANSQEAKDLKARVNLVSLMQSHGLKVRKSGQGYKALCPFHAEETPSLSIDPEKGLYHCFGCSASGDHYTFLQQHCQMKFPEAVKQLKGHAGETEPVAQEPFPYDLMNRVAEVWHRAFCEQPEGLQYLESRGLGDRKLLRDLKVGYCDGKSLSAITGKAERQALSRLGIFGERGNEFFSHCVVFPLEDQHGRVVGFYGRATLPGAIVNHRLTEGPKLGLFHRQAAHGASCVYLVESILDALALHQVGFTTAIALGGVQGLNEALLDHLKVNKVQRLVLCLDGDEAGRKASQSLKATLADKGFQVEVLQLPEGKDPCSCTQQELRQALEPAPVIPLQAPPQWEYQVLTTSGGKLKVLVRLRQEGQVAEATVDLYSPRSRQAEGLKLARKLDIPPEDVDQWLFWVLNEISSQKIKEQEAQGAFAKVEVPPMTGEQRREAMEFLKNPNLIQLILGDMEALGYMGEEEGKLLVYCVSSSRKFPKPMSAIIQSGSGAGKSFLSEVVIALTPPEDVVYYSRLSQQALYHMPKDFLIHKYLHLEEHIGGDGCDYQIRALQSSHRLVQAIVVKDPNTGALYTKENEVLGPIAFTETTTNLKMNPENTSRCFEVPLDESPEQTRRIHLRQKQLRSFQGLSLSRSKEGIRERHHNAQRLLEHIPVVIPYVDQIAFPDHSLRARRDHDRFLCLIEVLTYLHQFQRPRELHEGTECLVANLDDYRWAYFLASKVLRGSLDELSRWGRELMGYFEQEKPQKVTRGELRERLQWPDHRLRDALEELVELEYLYRSNGRFNLYTYQMADRGHATNPIAGLLTPEELAKQWS